MTESYAGRSPAQGRRYCDVMAVLPIRITGDPVLHRPAAPVGEVTEAVRTLVADMFDTMDAAPGVGLAGPQVGVGQRLFVYAFDEADGTSHRGVAIDPELWVAPSVPVSREPLDEDDEEEGCLSVPGERFPLRRHPAAILRARDLDGERYEIQATGWFARILQHEYDHLDGLLYVDRLDHPHAKAAAKVIRKKSWGVPGASWTPGVERLEG